MANTSPITISNKALFLLGAKQINSFEDEEVEAVAVNTFYESSLETLLCMYPWKFAQAEAKLALIANETPIDEAFKYIYQIPNDALNVYYTLPHNDYKILGDKIYSNYTPLMIKYTKRPQEELFTATFEQTLVYYLASQMCITITEETTKNNLLYTQYQDHLKRAKSIDSQQAPSDGFIDSPIDHIRYT